MTISRVDQWIFLYYKNSACDWCKESQNVGDTFIELCINTYLFFMYYFTQQSSETKFLF